MVTDFDSRERRLIRDIRRKCEDLLRTLKDLEKLDIREHREKIIQRLETEEVREVKDLIRALIDASIILQDLFLYFDLLVQEVKMIPDSRFVNKIESMLVREADAIRRRLESVINRLERYGIKTAKR